MVRQRRRASPPPRPTEAELEILRVLWRRGPSAVADVRAGLPRDVGYTTVLKLLQIMLEKGLVRRDESERRHLYEAAAGRLETQARLVSDLVARAFEGSAAQLVQRALSAKPVPEEELREIEAVLESLRERRAAGGSGSVPPVAGRARRSPRSTRGSQGRSREEGEE
jgi:predicted transcriptional regulator